MRILGVLLLGALAGCGPGLPSPMDLSQLAEHGRPARALPHYLAQPDARPEACDPTRQPAVPRLDGPVLEALFADETVPGEVRTACLLQVPAEQTTAVYGALCAQAARRITRGHPATRWVDAILARPAGVRLPASGILDARRALSDSPDPDARRLLRGIELDAGLLDGLPVDLARVATLTDEQLAEVARRIPDPAIAHAARGRLLRHRLAASPFAWVRADVDAHADLVLATGALPVPAGSPVLGARWAPGPDGARTIRIQVDPETGGARLVSVRPDRVVAAEPALDLAGLALTVEGFEHPIGPCPSGDPLDPRPCVPMDRLDLEDRFATLDGPRVVLASDLGLDDVVLLARGGDGFAPPLRVDGLPVAEFAFGLHFDPVPPLVLMARSGMNGPDLRVELVEISHQRLLVGVQRLDDGTRHALLVPSTDTGFAVISRGRNGAPGAQGTQGTQGTMGAAGMTGTCSSPGGQGGTGGAGGPGGAGRQGGAGGHGGRVSVDIRCDRCDALRAFAVRQVRSEGGQGGPGGAGGQGGQGGQGGMGGMGGSCTETDPTTGRTTYKTTPSGSPGMQGAKGPQGPHGAAGTDGTDGPVSVRVLPPG